MKLLDGLRGAGAFLAVCAGVAGAPVERAVTLADGTALVFVEVPAGRFRMGSPEAETGRGSSRP